MITGQKLRLIQAYPPEAIALIVLELIQELRVAEATLILFDIHKIQQQKWFNVRDRLLHSYGNFRYSVIIVTSLLASAQQDMSNFYSLIPGLKTLVDTIKSARYPVAEEKVDGKTPEQIREEFWEKLCNEHPEESKCKCFDL